jgi:shikimate kinase
MIPPTIYLTGFMGAGKTSVGRWLARRLRRPFVDLDTDIENRTGRTIAELFNSGSTVFRRFEAQALRRASRRRRLVIALGGGALLAPANRRLVADSGILVCLTCAEDRLWNRLREDVLARPLLGSGPRRRERMRRLLARRRNLYRKSDFSVSTSRRTPAQSAALIARKLEGRLLS